MRNNYILQNIQINDYFILSSLYVLIQNSEVAQMATAKYMYADIVCQHVDGSFAVCGFVPKVNAIVKL